MNPSRPFSPGLKRTVLRTTGALLVLLLVSCTRQARQHRVERRADSYFTAGEFDKAKVEYLNLLRFTSTDPLPYQRLGAIWMKQGAILRAAPFLLKTRELAPNDMDNRLSLGRVFLTLNHRKEALAEAMYVLQHSPDNLEAAGLAAEAAQNPDDQASVEQVLSSMPNQSTAGWQLARAILAVRRNDRDSARQAVEKVLAIDPKSASAHSLMATLLLLDGKSVEAGNEFKLAADYAPPRSPERLRYAQYQIQSGATGEAVKTMSSATSVAPDYLPAWLLQADVALSKNNYDEALKLIANVLNRDSENLDGSVLQARALIGKGETDKALKGLQGLDSRFSEFAPLKYEIARCFVLKNDSKQAVTYLNQALSTNPDFLDAALLLGQVNLRIGNAQAVVDSMKTFLARHPEQPAVKLLLADGYRALGQLDDAAALFRDEVKTSPKDPQPYIALGVILRQQGKPDEARQLLEQAVQLAPANPMPLLQLVDIDLVAHNFDAAHHRIEERLQATPDSAFLFFLQGRVFASEQKWDQAEASLLKALNLNPNFPNGYALLASVYEQSNKLTDAAKQLETVVNQNPHDTRALMSLAVLYDKMRNFEKARDTYEKLLAISPDFVPALNNLAFINIEYLQQPDRAYQLAEKARALQPTDGSIADTFGWILFKKRDYQQAIGLLSDAVTKSPGDPEIQYHFGMCRYMMGDADAAKTAFEQALKSPGDFPHKDDVERRLALLSKAQTGGDLNLKDLESFVHEQPDDIVARTRLAEKYQAEGMPKQAATEYEELIKLNPRLVPVMVSLAGLYSDSLNDSAKALELAKKARDLSPGDARTTLLLGRIAYKSGNYSWAYSLLKQSSGQLTDDPASAHALGWAAFGVGKIPEAIQQMQQVTEMAPQSEFANDAKTFLAMMQTDESRSPGPDEIAAVLKKDPNYIPAQIAQAALAAKNGDTNQAITAYQQVLTRIPDFGPVEKRLAALFMQPPADLTKASDMANKARKNLPDDLELTRLLAEISYQQKEYSRVLQLLDEVSRKEPLDAKELYLVGVSSAQTKDTARAREALTNALTSGLQDPQASDARRTLQALK
jgi:tetratricopeptide (TPR) repeat protein